MEFNESSDQREIFSHKCLCLKKEVKYQINSLILQFKELEKEK